MGIETALSAIEFNQRQDLQKEEKSRYERETRLKGPPIEIRYPSFSCPLPSPSPLFVIYGDYGSLAAWSGVARKMIFFEIEAGIRDRNWPTASYSDSHRSAIG